MIMITVDNGTDFLSPPSLHSSLLTSTGWLTARRHACTLTCKLLRRAQSWWIDHLIISLEAGRSLARAVPHGHAQGYADVRSTGQAIHRAKVFLFVGKLETRSPLRSAMAALRLSWSRFAYITCTSYMHRACIGQKTPTRLQLHFHLGTTVHTSFPRRYTTASAA